MAKFKVGDRVLYSKSTVISLYFEAVITEVDKTWYRVEYTDNNGNVQNEKCTEDEISLVATPKFSLINTVTVIDNDSPYYGMSGTVKNIDSYQNVIYYDIILDYVYFKNGCTLARRQYFTDDQLKNWENKDQAILGSKTCEAKYDNINNGSSKFKVGDRIKISHLYEASSEEWKGLANRTGKISIVLDSFKPPMYRVVLDGEPFMSTGEGFKMIHDYLNFNENELELAEEEKETTNTDDLTFKLGDKVKYKLSDSSVVEGEIINIEWDEDDFETWYTIEYKDENGNTQVTDWARYDDLTPIKDPKFKVGDVVTVLYESYEGLEGIVSRVMDNADNTRYIVNIRSEDKVLMVVFGEEDIELSPNQDKFGSNLYIGYHKPRFKKGDLVVVTESYRIASCWYRIATVTNVIVSSTLKEMKNTYLLLFAEERFNSCETFDEMDLMKVPREPRFKLGDKVDVMFLPKIKGARTITGVEYLYKEDKFKYHVEGTVDGKVQKDFCSEAKITPADPEELKPMFTINDLVYLVGPGIPISCCNCVAIVTEVDMKYFSTSPYNEGVSYTVELKSIDHSKLDDLEESNLRLLTKKPKFSVYDMVKFETQDGESECIGQVDKVLCDVNDSGEEKFRYGIICRKSNIGYFCKFESELEPYLYHVEAQSILKSELENVKVTVEEPKFKPSNYVENRVIVKEPKFKPGDYVEVNTPITNIHDSADRWEHRFDGEKAIVEEVIYGTNGDTTYKLRFPCYTGNPVDMEFTKDQLKHTDTLEGQKREPKFKKGDIVEFHPDDPGAPADYTIWGKIVIIETPVLRTDPFVYIIDPLVGISVKRYYKIKEDDLKLAEMADPSFHLFVSQPMSGLDMEDILKARQSAIDTFKNLYEQSCNIDPDLKLVVIDNIQEEFTKQCEQEGRTPHSLEYLGNDIKMMKDADAIMFAKGWEKSKGCSVEFLVAKNNSIPMYFE